MVDTSSDALAIPVALPVMAPFPHPKKFLIAPPNSSSSTAFVTSPAFIIRMPSIPHFNLRESSESLRQECKNPKLLVCTRRSNDFETMLIALYVYEIWNAHAIVDEMKSSGDLERMGIKERKFWIAETTRRVAVVVDACEKVMVSHPETNEQVVKAFRKQHHSKVKNYRADIDFEAEPYFENESPSSESDEEYEELRSREFALEVKDRVPVTRRNETRRDRGSKRRDVQLVEPVEPHDSDSEPLISANSGRGTRRAESKRTVHILTAKRVTRRRRTREVSTNREHEITAIVKSNSKKGHKGKVVDSSDSEYDPTYRPVETKRNKRRAKSSKTQKARSKKPYLEYYYDF